VYNVYTCVYNNKNVLFHKSCILTSNESLVLPVQRIACGENNPLLNDILKKKIYSFVF